jgi:hypothetical protein
MGKPLIRELGTVEGICGERIAIGTERGAVALYFGAWLSADGVRLDGERATEFARLWVAACCEAAAQDEDGGVSGARPSSGPWPATAAGDQLAAGDFGGLAPAASTDLEALARDMLASFVKTSDGYRARAGQVQIARWTAQLERRGHA